MELAGRAPPQARPSALRDVVAQTLELPAMPFIATRVMRAVDDPSSTVNVIAAIVEADPGITAWIMRVVNSAAFGRQRRVTSLPQAVALLGYVELKNLVVSASVRALYRSFGPVEKAMWQHSVAVGAGARLVAMRAARPAREAAFLAGQMHDIGKLVLRNQFAKQFEQSEGLLMELGPTASEEHVFGYAHTDVGALLMQRWSLPSAIEASAFYHHDLDLCSSLAAEHLTLVACVALADTLSDRIMKRPCSAEDDEITVQAAEILGLGPAEIEELGGELDTAIKAELTGAT
jgi:HD-like signal output (HDOD) protein